MPDFSDFLRSALRVPPAPEPTKVQQAINAAVCEWARLNGLIQALNAAPAAALTILRECESALLRSAAHFAEARRLVESGESILPVEGETYG